MMDEARLDTLLGAWAAEQRLAPADAAAILQTVLREPREVLPATWWSDLSSQVSAAMVQATTRPWTAFVPTAAAA